MHVLALHGWFGSAARGWGFLPELIDRERQTWAFLDCRGYGERRGVPGEHTIAEISADALALADELGWERFAVAGHSMGGSAAQHVLADAPGRVSHLIGISPVPASGMPFDERGRTLFAGAAHSPADRRFIVDHSTGRRLSSRWVDSVARGDDDVDAFEAYFPAWADTDFTVRVAGHPVPALAVIGAHDRAIDEPTMRATWMSTYPNARLEILADAGHYAMFESPVRLVTLIDDFLAD